MLRVGPGGSHAANAAAPVAATPRTPPATACFATETGVDGPMLERRAREAITRGRTALGTCTITVVPGGSGSYELTEGAQHVATLDVCGITIYAPGLAIGVAVGDPVEALQPLLRASTAPLVCEPLGARTRCTLHPAAKVGSPMTITVVVDVGGTAGATLRGADASALIQGHRVVEVTASARCE